MSKTIVTLNGKQYSVLRRNDGSVDIWTSWESIVPSTAYSAHPTKVTRSASVSPYGRLGKKILECAERALASEK